MSWHRLAPRDCVEVLVLVIVAVACATPGAARVDVHPPGPPPSVHGMDRLMVAGFVAGSVTDRRGGVDVNEETARLLRSELRSKALLQVIETEPLRFESGPADSAFGDASFWRRIGEEYGQPLILTGTLDFKPAGYRYEEQMAGRRTRRIWRPEFSLTGTVVLIDGRTGERIDSLTLGRLTAYASTSRESALTIYFRLMDQAMPSILTLLGQEMAHERVLLR